MTNNMVSNELIFEVLKKIQADVVHIKTRVDDHDQQFIALREQMHSMAGDIHILHGEILRVDKQLVSVGQRLDRIERRFDLTDAE